ncbi:MAG: hypothetical protein ACOYOA_15560 [Saprospiraceae bacterium]
MLIRNLTVIGLLILPISCVQKAYYKTIVFELDTSAIPNIKSVGIRGNDKPFNWDSSLDMAPVVKDSIYKATATFLTGYRFTEVKFTINDEFELKDQENRRIYFSDKDTTFFKAIFNKVE